MSARPIGPQIQIRELRNAHGLSVQELAERIRRQGRRVHEDTIRNVELGHKKASQPLLAAWARALGVSLLDVVWQPPRESATDEAGAASIEEGAA